MKFNKKFKIKNNYVRNVIWQMSGNTTAQIINISSMPIISRLFQPDDFGQLSLAMQIMTFCTILISLRVEHIILLPKLDSQARYLMLFVINYGLCMTVIICVIAATFAIFVDIPDHLKDWIFIIPVTAYTVVSSMALQQFCQRSGNFKFSGLSEVINRGTNALISITSGFLGMPGYFLGIANISGFSAKAILFIFLNRQIQLTLISSIYQGFKAILRQQAVKILGSLVASHLLLFMTSGVPLGYIGYKYGSDHVGYYSLVLSTLALPATLVGNAVGHVYYQSAARNFAMQIPFVDLFISNLRFLLLIGVPSFTAVSIISPWMYPIIFGSSWVVSGEIAKIMAISSLFAFISVPFDRSGIIVNAWWYGPSWHLMRCVSVCGVILVVHRFDFEFNTLILLLTLQGSALYVIDCFASFVFSKRRRKF